MNLKHFSHLKINFPREYHQKNLKVLYYSIIFFIIF